MKRVINACLLVFVILACSQVVFAQLASSCWPKFHRDYANTGQGLYGGTGSDLTWVFTADGTIRSAPVIGTDGTVYFTCGDGRLYAVAGSGVKRWDIMCNCVGTASPAVALDGTIYVGSNDNNIYAIKPDGTVKWKKLLTSRPDTSVSIGIDGSIYVGCVNKTVYALGSNGILKWTYTTGGAVSSSPAVGLDGSVYFGCLDGKVYALSSTGALKWKFSPVGAGTFVASPTIGPDGTVYIGSTGGYFYAISTSGTQKWRVNAGGDVRSSAALSSNGNIYYGCRDYKIHVLTNLGASIWTYTTGHYVDSSVAVGLDGGGYVGSCDGKLYAFNPDGTQRWQYDTGGAVYSSPAIGPAGALFIGSDNGSLYCFAADSTLPMEPIVADDGNYTFQIDRIHGTWSAADPESGIFSYEYCIGTEPGLSDIAPWLNVGSATQHTRIGLSLSDKQTYYISVRAINGAGLTGPVASSDGIIVDATAPVRPSVTDDGRYSSNANTIQATWTSSDVESGIAGYQYSIGTTPGGTTIVGWTDAGTGTSIQRTGLTLVSGTTYYINVKARNGGGGYSEVGSSDGITVDTTIPSTPVVVDVGEYLSDPHSVFASWSSADNESGVIKFEYSVGTAPGGTQTLSWTDAGTSTQATIAGLELTNGVRYYVNVRATNGALLISSAGSSDGAILDVTAPDAPVVTDDGDYTASTTQLRASWTCSDAQSGIKTYKYAIGTSSGSADVVGWTDVGTNTSITKTGLSLSDKKTYYFSVKAVNGAIAESAAGLSNGITVDATAPTKPVVTDDGDYTAESNQLHATWVCEDLESGITRYEYSIGTSAGSTDIVNWTDIGANTAITRTGLVMQDGRTYYINVRGYNRLGLVGEVGSSNGIILDTVTPPAPVTTDDGQFIASTTSLHAVWTAVTCRSGIAFYEYSIGTTPEAANVKGWTSNGLQTQVTANGLTLQNGATYFISVRARNSLGKAGFIGTSDGIVVDTTPPATPTVTDGGAFAGSATQLTASWSSQDAESGVVEYKYAVGTTPGGTNVLNWTSAGTQTSATISSLSLNDGGKYYISIKARNGAGSESAVGTADGITVDLTPASKPAVVDDGNHTVDGSQLHATWSASDPQSGIIKYEYSIGTSAGSANILNWTSAGTSTQYTITDLALVTGQSYYINVRATNGANVLSEVGSSNGIFVETTPPTIPVVTDEGAYTQSTTSLRASWTSDDPETGVAGYEYSIGTEAGIDDVVSWTNIATATSIERNDLVLVSGNTYYVNVKATNNIGLISEIGSSDGITVDTTKPEELIVTDDGAFTADNTQLRVSLECVDAESGIVSYECAVGTTPEGTDIVDWADAGSGPEAVIFGLQLQDGVKYYVSARATNGAGIKGDTGVSDGITVDATGPVNVVVQDDGQYTGSETQLHGKWSATDPQSGIAGYKYCIGTSAGLNDVADWFDAGNVTEHTRQGLTLFSGTTYYISVVAINNAGGESLPASSDGIKLDLTPPSKPSVADTGTYWGSRTSMFASWQSDDPESGIAEYQMSVGTAPGADDVAPWANIGNRTSYTRMGLLLNNGVTYYVNIKALNGAGVWGEAGSSDGVLIDSTPPTPPVVTDDGDTTSILDRLHATWLSEDPESGIAEYMYCIGTSPGATDVVAWTSAGLSQDVTVTGISLDPVLRYYFSVKARSNSGAWSAVSASDGIGFSSGAAIWWRFRNDTGNKGRGLFNATTVNEVGWIIPTQGYVESSPAIAADGTTYIGSGDGKIYAITQNGTLRWAYDTGASIDSSPAIASDGKILIGCNDGRLLCLEPSGELEWAYQTGDAVRCSPLVNDGVVYVGSLDGSMYAIKLEDGTLSWKYTTGGAVWSSPAADEDGVIYFGSGDAYIYAINDDGTLKWRYATGSAVDCSPAIGPDGTVYIGSGDGGFYAINPDGTRKWRMAVNVVSDSSPAVGPDGTIYFGIGYDGGDGKFQAVSPEGSIVWQVSLPKGGVVSSPAIDPSGRIYVGSGDGKMYAFNPNGTICWTFKTMSSVVSSPALGADSSVVFGSYDGNIYCLRDVTSKDLTPPNTPVVTVPSLTLTLGSALSASWSSSDPDSMVAEYTYAVGTEPGLSDVAGWTSTGIETSMSRDDLVLNLGQTYYVSVKARNPSQRWSDVGVSGGVTIVSETTATKIGEVKLLEDEASVSLLGKVVTASFDDCFFIAEPSRIAGIRCYSSVIRLYPGDIVNVNGSMDTLNDERVIVISGCEVVGSGDLLAPLGLTGSALKLNKPDLTGLYVKLCGMVTAAGSDYVVVNDGSNLQTTREVLGIEVQATGGANTGDFVTASGILCRELVNGQPATVVRTVASTGLAVVKPGE